MAKAKIALTFTCLCTFYEQNARYCIHPILIPISLTTSRQIPGQGYHPIPSLVDSWGVYLGSCCSAANSRYPRIPLMQEQLPLRVTSSTRDIYIRIGYVHQSCF